MHNYKHYLNEKEISRSILTTIPPHREYFRFCSFEKVNLLIIIIIYNIRDVISPNKKIDNRTMYLAICDLKGRLNGILRKETSAEKSV